MWIKKITYHCHQCNVKLKSPYTQYTYTGDEIKRVCKVKKSRLLTAMSQRQIKESECILSHKRRN